MLQFHDMRLIHISPKLTHTKFFGGNYGEKQQYLRAEPKYSGIIAQNLKKPSGGAAAGPGPPRGVADQNA
jgi:hypothetical protein